MPHRKLLFLLVCLSLLGYSGVSLMQQDVETEGAAERVPFWESGGRLLQDNGRVVPEQDTAAMPIPNEPIDYTEAISLLTALADPGATYMPEEVNCMISTSTLEGIIARLSPVGIGDSSYSTNDAYSVDAVRQSLNQTGPNPVNVIVLDFLFSDYIDDPATTTHGDAVVAYLDALTDSPISLTSWDVGGKDTNDLSTFLGGEISSSVTLGTPVIVNMSFALVPCSTTDVFRYLSDSQYTQQDYEDDTGYGSDAILDAVEQIVTSSSNDMLGALVNTCYATEVLFVAGTGNEGRDFAYYPARWPGVIGIGASDELDDFDGLQRSWYSNQAEPGEYEFGGPLWGLLSTGDAVIGTSFAAPLRSARLALNLTQPTDERSSILSCEDRLSESAQE